MLLRPMTDGSVTGTGTMQLQGRILGGVLITADGTNNATVIVRRTSDAGFQVFKLVTKSPVMIAAPIGVDAEQAYFSVSGTGAAAQFFEWVS
jgi:hypothetical protein